MTTTTMEKFGFGINNMEDKSLDDIIKMVNDHPEAVQNALNKSQPTAYQDYAEHLFRWLSSSCSPEKAKHVARVIQFNDSPWFGAKNKKALLITHMLILHSAIAIHSVNKICDQKDVMLIVDAFRKLAFKHCFTPVEAINKKINQQYENGLKVYFDFLKSNSSHLDLSNYFISQLKLKKDIEVGETYVAIIIGQAIREIEGYLLVSTGAYHHLETTSDKKVTLGPFFEIIVHRYIVDKSYPDGSFGLVRDAGIKGEINNDFIIWGTMGADDRFGIIIDNLEAAKLNCDNDDDDCVYVLSEFGRPLKERSWLAHDEREHMKCNAWLKV